MKAHLYRMKQHTSFMKTLKNSPYSRSFTYTSGSLPHHGSTEGNLDVFADEVWTSLLQLNVSLCLGRTACPGSFCQSTHFFLLPPTLGASECRRVCGLTLEKYQRLEPHSARDWCTADCCAKKVHCCKRFKLLPEKDHWTTGTMGWMVHF